MGLVACTDMGSLTINSVNLFITGCWTVTNIEELWTGNAARGGNVVIAGATGQRAYPWRLDQSVYLLEMLFSGENNSSGTPYSNPYTGLVTNIEAFRAGVVAPPSAPTATYSATLTLPGGSTRTANVQPRVLTVKGSGGGPFADGQLELVVPLGRFA